MRRLSLVIALLAVPAFAHLYPEWVSSATGASNYDFRSIATADFNGDGRPDLLLRERDHYVDLILGGDPSSVGIPTRIFTSDYISDVAIADVDGDGRPDVVVADIAGNTLTVLRSNGDGTFAAPVVTVLSFAPSEIALGDFDADHRVDVAIRSRSAAILAIYTGDGTGHFNERRRTAISNASYDMTCGDVDGDGKLDVVIARSDASASGLDVYFGRSDGSFDGPTSVAAANGSNAIVVADLDGDGRLEILTTEFAPNTLTVYRNAGGRTFASPASYFVARPNDNSPGNPGQPAVTDVDGDGKPDVVVPLANERSVVTLIGNGDGSLAPPIGAVLPQTATGFLFPIGVVAGAFTGNGSHDVAVLMGASSGVMLLRNAAGEVRVSLRSDFPVVSQSQPFGMTATVDTAKGFVGWSSSSPFPSGAVTLFDGSAVLGSGTPKNGSVRLTVPGLTTGSHSLVARFAGDDAFLSGDSAPYVETVTAQTTTTTLTSNMPGTEVPFGYGTFSLTATVQSPIAGDARGQFFLAIDGVRNQSSIGGPPAQWFPSFIHAGTHTFQAFYNGNATQPPSTSNIVTQVIKRASSSVMVPGGFQVAAYRPLMVRVYVDGPSADTPNLGAITVLEGTKVLARTTITMCCWSGGTSMEIPLPPWTGVGMHMIHATYGGDMDYAPSTSSDQQVIVTPGTPLHGHAARH